MMQNAQMGYADGFAVASLTRLSFLDVHILGIAA